MKLNVEQYKVFLEELAKGKKVDVAEIKNKLANCGTPGVTGTAVVRNVLFLILNSRREECLLFLA